MNRGRLPGKTRSVVCHAHLMAVRAVTWRIVLIESRRSVSNRLVFAGDIKADRSDHEIVQRAGNPVRQEHSTVAARCGKGLPTVAPAERLVSPCCTPHNRCVVSYISVRPVIRHFTAGWAALEFSTGIRASGCHAPYLPEQTACLHPSPQVELASRKGRIRFCCPEEINGTRGVLTGQQPDPPRGKNACRGNCVESAVEARAPLAGR